MLAFKFDLRLLINILVLKSSFAICIAYISHSFLLNEKAIMGAMCLSINIFTILKQFVLFTCIFCLRLSLNSSLTGFESDKIDMAKLKLSSRKLP